MPEKKAGGRRKRDSQATKTDLLEAAQRCFTRESYEHVTLHDIAREAGVNSTLIGRYFGSKEGLFIAAICDSFGMPGEILAVDRDQLCEAMTRWILQPVTDNGFNLTLALMRSAPSRTAGPLLRQALGDRFIIPLAKHLDGEEARLRAAVMSSLTLGACVLRDVVGVEALQDANQDLLVHFVTQMLGKCMTLPIAGGKTHKADSTRLVRKKR